MLWVADADGENAQSALSSTEPIISPAWSPNGAELAYVSFEARKPVIYVHEVATGRRRLVANFRGSNSAPAWSPDGKTLAVTLTRDGLSQLYTISSHGGEPKRLTQSNGIDTEPAFSADGQTIFFVSDRGGSPQIYKVPVSGGSASHSAVTTTFRLRSAPMAAGWRTSRVWVELSSCTSWIWKTVSCLRSPIPPRMKAPASRLTAA